jgi:hypothetical protein
LVCRFSEIEKTTRLWAGEKKLACEYVGVPLSEFLRAIGLDPPYAGGCVLLWIPRIGIARYNSWLRRSLDPEMTEFVRLHVRYDVCGERGRKIDGRPAFEAVKCAVASPQQGILRRYD